MSNFYCNFLLKLALTVVWRDVRNGVGSGFEFSKRGVGGRGVFCFIPSKWYKTIKKVPNQTFTKTEAKGESRKLGSGGGAPAEGPVRRSRSKGWF